MTVLRLPFGIEFWCDINQHLYFVKNDAANERLIATDMEELDKALRKIMPSWNRANTSFHEAAESTQMQFVRVDAVIERYSNQSKMTTSINKSARDYDHEPPPIEIMEWATATCKSPHGVSFFCGKQYFWFASLADYTAFKLRWL